MQPRRKRIAPILAALMAVVIALWLQRTRPETATPTTTAAAPSTRVAPSPAKTTTTAAPRTSPLDALDASERAEIDKTLALIRAGGPFPHRQDGSTFSNREARLPLNPRGYYREYTVKTAGASNRGARRIVRGSKGETYYTRDHYETFVRIDVLP
jgi:ribonuclease T1